MTAIEFIEHYEKYLIGDTEAMMQKADEDSTGNQMSVPITFSIFSCLDIFGFLISYDQTSNSDVNKGLGNTSFNIANSMLKFNCFGFTEFDFQTTPSSQNNPLLFNFITICRHGIMHTFFPKAFEISNSFNGDSNKLFQLNDEKLIFNVRKFYKCFQDFLAKFKEELSSNDEFRARINNNIQLFLDTLNNDVSYNNFKREISNNVELINSNSQNTVTTQTTIPPSSDILNITGSLV
jgi:hypothetical protein